MKTYLSILIVFVTFWFLAGGFIAGTFDTSQWTVLGKITIVVLFILKACITYLYLEENNIVGIKKLSKE